MLDHIGYGDMQPNVGKNSMDVSDIVGAKPKQLYPSRRFGNVGANVMVDNTRMAAAGGMKRDDSRGAMNDVFNMGDQFNRIGNRNERNPLSTKDINGEKKNQFGQRMMMPGQEAPIHKPRFEQMQGYPPEARGYAPSQHSQPQYPPQYGQDHYNKENENDKLSPSMRARKEELLREY